MEEFEAPLTDMAKTTGGRPGTKLTGPRRVTAFEVSRLVGRNLRDARKAQGYSLESLAKASGVSRAMLGQIETGKSVPTITVIWRVADALGIAVERLIASPAPDAFVVLTRDDHASAPLRNGGIRSRVLVDPETQDTTRFIELRIGSGHSEVVKAASQSARVTLVVARGALDVTLGGNSAVHLEEGDAILFDARTKHTIANADGKESTAYLVVQSRRGGGAET